MYSHGRTMDMTTVPLLTNVVVLHSNPKDHNSTTARNIFNIFAPRVAADSLHEDVHKRLKVYCETHVKSRKSVSLKISLFA